MSNRDFGWSVLLSSNFVPTLWAEAHSMARYARHITHDIIWIEHSPLSSTSYEDIVLGFYSNSAKNESCFPFKNKFGELYFINFFFG